MIPVDDAVAHVVATVATMPVETVPVTGALGRVLAHDVVSPVDVPPWDNSAMDGYAVRAADLGDDGAALELLEVVPAGTMPTLAVGPGQATVVMTGAPMPEGADAVVCVEDSDGARAGTVHLSEGTRAGRYVRRRGADVVAGATVLTAGTVLTPARCGVLASVGLDTVEVRRRPRVAILTTGDEVQRPGAPLAPGAIHGSNHVVLAGIVAAAGGVPVDAGHVGDDPAALATALTDALAAADLVLTTGGVSVGDHDHVADVWDTLGIRTVFWKVRMKPGKPTRLGIIEVGGRSVPVLGLPGNPVSCAVQAHLLVHPWIRTSMGDPRPYLPMRSAVAGDDLRSRPGRARLERVTLDDTPDGLVARTTGDQSSGVLTSLARGQALLAIAPDDPGPCVGDVVRVLLLDPGHRADATQAFGW